MLGTLVTVIVLVSKSGLSYQLQSFDLPVLSQLGNLQNHTQRLDVLDKQRLRLNGEVANLSRTVTDLTDKNQSTQPKKGCPVGFALDNEAKLCYKILMPGIGDFHLATEFCKVAYGGQLAVLNNELKFKAIRMAIAHATHCVWLGGEIGDNGKFTQWHDGSKIKDGFWGKGEPNNPATEKCLALHKFPAEGYMLNDAVCSSACHFLCEVLIV